MSHEIVIDLICTFYSYLSFNKVAQSGSVRILNEYLLFVYEIPSLRLKGNANKQ